jgi:hypothetical protein
LASRQTLKYVTTPVLGRATVANIATGVIPLGRVAAQKATTSLEAQTAVAMEVHSKVRAFAERNVATCFEFAQKFVHAKNVQEVMQLQAELVKTQLQAITEQTTELARVALKTVVEATKPKD